MTDVTQILSRMEPGCGKSSAELLPLVYEELRKLAVARFVHERPNQTLIATAPVHEAYLRLLGPDDVQPQQWSTRGHFFAAAAEAMRRLLVEQARRKLRLRHGRGWHVSGAPQEGAPGAAHFGSRSHRAKAEG